MTDRATSVKAQVTVTARCADCGTEVMMTLAAAGYRPRVPDQDRAAGRGTSHRARDPGRRLRRLTLDRAGRMIEPPRGTPDGPDEHRSTRCRPTHFGMQDGDDVSELGAVSPTPKDTEAEEAEGRWVHVVRGDECPEQPKPSQTIGTFRRATEAGQPWWCTTHQDHLCWLAASPAVTEGERDGYCTCDGPRPMRDCGIKAHRDQAFAALPASPAVTDAEDERVVWLPGMLATIWWAVDDGPVGVNHAMRRDHDWVACGDVAVPDQFVIKAERIVLPDPNPVPAVTAVPAEAGMPPTSPKSGLTFTELEDALEDALTRLEAAEEYAQIYGESGL